MTANTADSGAADTGATNASAAETTAASTGAAGGNGEVVLRLVVEDLQVLRAPSRGRATVDVVDDISFRVQPGEVLGLVGESGSGKTTMALALLGYVRRGLVFGEGKVLVDGRDILKMAPDDLQHLRGRKIAYVPQDPSSALNPTLKVGTQLREVVDSYSSDHKVREDRLAEMLVEVGLSTVPGILDSYPHQLSGGQQQRVGIARALAPRPS